ncbi:MAG: hypothetical protein A2X94_10595 [Bdellovibrionales bacterium GWB1_55_8]|nr:MAG: hypothetical protein A2X94_10595 [Bdellovibrionales bacterium GWB1_55_8]
MSYLKQLQTVVLAVLLATGALGCTTGDGSPSTLYPESPAQSPAAGPTTIDQPSSSAPNSRERVRFFCEDGIIFNSILTFSSQASPEASASRIFFEDPARSGFFLMAIQGPLAVRSSKLAATLLFQAESLSGRIGEPQRKQGIYISEIDLLTRVAKVRLLTRTTRISTEALRIASSAGISLRTYGTLGSQIVVPSQPRGRDETGEYRVIEIEDGLEREIGRIACPPGECWNPELAGDEIWFTTLDRASGKFRIRAFNRGFEPIPFSQLTENSQQLSVKSGSGEAAWIEEAREGFVLGRRRDGVNTLTELPPTIHRYLPSAVALRDWNGNGETLAFATKSDLGVEQIWMVKTDQNSSRLDVHQTIPSLAGAELTSFVSANDRSLFGLFRSKSEKRLYRFDSESDTWRALTREVCENPTSGRFHE